MVRRTSLPFSSSTRTTYRLPTVVTHCQSTMACSAAHRIRGPARTSTVISMPSLFGVGFLEGDAPALNAGVCLRSGAPDEDCSESTESGAVPFVEPGLCAPVRPLPGDDYLHLGGP